MARDNVNRRLSAILAADVAGYSRLMSLDEAGTIERFRRIRSDVVEPLVDRHVGCIVGTAGDSFLIEFASALSAVQCAMDLQMELAQMNAEECEERRILFRIGVNLGDVIAEDATIHGDGVNIAARIEKLAYPGGICVSQSVLDLLGNRTNLSFVDIGEQALKNIPRSVRVYRAEVAKRTSQSENSEQNKATSSSAEKVSIAILPFDNMSEDPDQAYFSDGITEDIITELSRFRELLVTARNFSFQFRGRGLDLREIARTLGVQFLLEGSVRKVGNRVRVTAQLIDTASMSHVWAERYDRDAADILALQDEITQIVVTRVAGHAQSTAARRSRSRPTNSLSAYDNYLRARELFRNFGISLDAVPLLEKAIELDPRFAMAHAMLSDMRVIQYEYTCNASYLSQAIASGERALALDPEDPWTNYAFAFALIFARRLDEASYYFDKAIELNPNEAYFRAVRANLLRFKGHTEAAVREIDDAIKRDPYSYDWFWSMRGGILTNAGRYEEAIKSFRRAKHLPPWHECYLAICYIELDKQQEAAACLERFAGVVPDTPPEEYFKMMPYADSKELETLLAKLRRAAAAVPSSR
jgi:TolB-like protein/Flp pilus assembly protein TadD